MSGIKHHRVSLLFFLTALAWQPASSDSAADVVNKLRYQEKPIAGHPGTMLKLVFFDEKDFSLRVVVNSDRESAKRLDALGGQSGAVAVCNGGYYDVPKFLPVGLEISGGNRSGTFIPNHFGGGGIGVKNGKAAIVWDDEFQDHPDLKEYIHCSPWLVKEGVPWPMPEQGQEDSKNARTFILTDMNGHWAIGIVKGVGLSELAQLLVSPGVITEFTVKRALNLDGGPSTGLWCKKQDGTVSYTKPGWAVRNGIAILPRQNPLN